MAKKKKIEKITIPTVIIKESDSVISKTVNIDKGEIEIAEEE